MPARLTHRGNHLRTQLVRELAQLRRWKLAKVVWRINQIKQRRNRIRH
jgi:hypothetical protein